MMQGQQPNRQKTIFLSVLFWVCICGLFAGCGKGAPKLASWNEDSANRQAIIDYVEDITDQNSENFIPVKNRIATLDFDGTIISEKTTWLELAVAIHRIDTELNGNTELVDKKNKLLSNLKKNPEPDNTRELIEYVTGKAFEGMAQEDYIIYMQDFMQKPKGGFQDLKYADSYYKPMLELIDYLLENEFTVYIVSGSERAVMWGAAEGTLNLPRSQLIGGDMALIVDDRQASVTADTTGHDILEPGDELFRGMGFTQHSAGNSKVYNIYHQIGIRPVFACGNTQDDFSMLNYARYNPKYSGFAMLINHDDNEREFQYHVDKRKTWDALAQRYDWHVVSMKNDFKTIFLKETTKIQ